MAIVLAIEPDRRQAAYLTALVRQHVHAELVLADTTEGALDAIGNRVPDLVLVPALLSPQDDAALAAALRVIAAAAHVRTLTIPVLGNGSRREAISGGGGGGGMLAKWRRKNTVAPEPEGCEPAVFAEQISAYLQEAAAERARLDDELLGDEPATDPAPELRPSTPTFNSELATRSSNSEFAIPANSELAAPSFNSELWVEPTQDEEVGEPSIDLSDELAGLEAEDKEDEEAGGELFDGEPVGVYILGTDSTETPIEAFDLLQAILEPAAVVEPPTIAQAATSLEPSAVVMEPADPPAAPIAALADEVPVTVFVDSPEPPRADIEPWVPMYLTPGRLWPTLEGMPAEMPVARAEQPDWIELVASLRQDLERRRIDPASAAVDPIAARPSDGGATEAHRVATKPRPVAKQTKPIQDEWGFFDPEQCGFSTLLAKLEEITEEGTVSRSWPA